MNVIDVLVVVSRLFSKTVSFYSLLNPGGGTAWLG